MCSDKCKIQTSYDKEELVNIGLCRVCAVRFTTCDHSVIETAVKGEHQDDVHKMSKSNTCVSCLGLLQEQLIANFASEIGRKIQDSDFDCDSYGLALLLPSCYYIREHSVRLYIRDLHPDTTAEHLPYISLKEAWRYLMARELRPLVEKYFSSSSELLVTASVSYADNIKECSCLKSLMKRKRVKSHDNSAYPNSEICDVLDCMQELASFTKYSSTPPSVPSHSAQCSQVSVQRNSIFCAGRYNKFSRNLPQTPWILNGERKADTSVEEIITEQLKLAFRTSSCRFSSSGREDVDVRTLGNGRPFVVEFVNPHISTVTPSDLRKIENEINSRTEDVFIKHLQFVPRSDLKHLKEGEETKTKEYCSLCVVYGNNLPSNDVLKACCNIKQPLVIEQKTPIRVLHRRTAAIRQRVIYDMKMEIANFQPTQRDKMFIKLYVKTQAGTYVKEFVHGDFGRTSPSISSMLNVPVDVVALDVTKVDLDWPPPLEY